MALEIERRRVGGVWRTGAVDDPGESGGLPAGGSTGEVLTKASNADGDADWEPGGGSQPGALISSPWVSVLCADLPDTPGEYTAALFTPTEDDILHDVLVNWNPPADHSTNVQLYDGNDDLGNSYGSNLDTALVPAVSANGAVSLASMGAEFIDSDVSVLNQCPAILPATSIYLRVNSVTEPATVGELRFCFVTSTPPA